MFMIALIVVPVLVVLAGFVWAWLPWPYDLLACLPVAFAALLAFDLWHNRRDWLHLVLPVACALALILASGAVFAADTAVPIGAILGDLRGPIETLLVTVTTVVIGVIGYFTKRYLGISIDGKMREALQSALENGIRVGLDATQERFKEGQLDVRTPIIAGAIAYVREYAPKAIRHFGLTDRDLTELLRAQLLRVLPEIVQAEPSRLVSRGKSL